MKHDGRLLVVLVLLSQLLNGHFEPMLRFHGLALTGLILYLSSCVAIFDAGRSAK